MMLLLKGTRTVLLYVAIVALLAGGAAAAPGPKDRDDQRKGPRAKPVKVKHLKRGESYCPAATLIVGNVIVQGGRCYTLFVMRDGVGTFLAFGQPGIPPGQLVRLNTPAGAKVKGRIFYLIPIRTTAVLIPINTISLVAVRADDFGPRVAIVLMGVPVPNVTVIFDVRL